MRQEVLAAIMGAVAAYIQQEESVAIVPENRMNAWRFLGQRAQMRARTTTRQAAPHPGRGVWWYCGLEKSMIDRMG